MATPSINESPSYEVIASGVPYSKQLTATNTPTSWNLTGQPAGITINSAGLATGTPTVTAPTAYTFSATATNGDGTSAAKTWLVVVVPYVAGGPSNAFTRALDLDFDFRTLQIPGVGSPLPKRRATSPATLVLDGEEFTDETEYLLAWTTGDRFTLSLGVVMKGVLQDLDITNIDVVLREQAGERKIVISEGALTPTGSGSVARFERMLFLDEDELDPIVSAYESAAHSIAPMLLGLSISVADDDRDFSGTDSEAIPTLTQGDTDVDTMTVAIATHDTTETLYDVAVALVCPTDTGLNISLTQRIALTWNGSAYVLGDVTGTDTGTGNATDARDWDTTLEITNLAATGTGISVETTVTTTAQSSTVDNVVCVIDGAANSFSTDGSTISHATSFDVEFKDDTSTIIGSAVTISDGDSEADVLAAIETATGEEVTSVTFDSGTNNITIVFGEGATVDEYTIGASTEAATVNMHAVPSYSNAAVSVTVTGVEMPERSETITSAAVPVLIERKMTRE